MQTQIKTSIDHKNPVKHPSKANKREQLKGTNQE